MAKFNIDDSSSLSMPEMIEIACREIEEDLKPLSIHLEGYYDSSRKLLTIIGRTFDNEQIHSKYLKIFFDVLHYIPMNIKGTRYRFQLVTYSDFKFKNEKHVYYLETALEKLPGTAHITRRDWETFTAQLVHTKNGRRISLPMPESFYEDPEEEKYKRYL